MMILIIWTLILHFYGKDIFYYILYTLNGYCFCFSMLLIEYINRKYFINVYLLGSILGICETIQYFIEKRSPRIDIKLSFLFLLFFISYIINYFLHFTIILKIGTIHSYMSDFISYFLLKSVYNFETSMNFLFSLISILTSLIYLEILELNFCDLNYYLKKNIYKRGRSETNNAIISFLKNYNENVDID